MCQFGYALFAAQKIKLLIKDFFSKCDQIRRNLKKSLIKNFIFCTVIVTSDIMVVVPKRREW